MKSILKYQNFANELKELCEKHGVGLIGTCSSEGIYGEITLFDLSEPDESSGLINVKENYHNYQVKDKGYL